MRIRLPLFVLIVGVLALAGCGGSSKTGSSSTSAVNTETSSTSSGSGTATTSTTPVKVASGTPLSKSRLVAGADAICKRLSLELDASNKLRTQQDVIRAVQHRTAIEKAALVELSKLVPPTSLAKDYQKLLSARQTVIEDIKKLGEDVEAKNSSAEGPVYVSSGIVLRQMAATAKHSGFKYCGQLG